MFSGELLLRPVMRAVVAVLLLDQRVLLSNTVLVRLPVNDDANLKWGWPVGAIPFRSCAGGGMFIFR